MGPSRKGTIRPSPEDVIAFVDDSGASVRTMTLHIADTLALHLRRRAGATYYFRDFALFDELVLGRLAASAAGATPSSQAASARSVASLSRR